MDDAVNRATATTVGGIADRLDAESHRPLTMPQKSLPGDFEGTLADVATRGWSVLRDVPLPVMTLDRHAMASNIDAMHSYVAARGALLAPHGKTSMCPGVWERQLAAGAWAITVANLAQLEVCVKFAVPRVLIANEVVGRYDLARLADIVSANLRCEIMCLVDSPESVTGLNEALTRSGGGRRLDVLVEFGMPGGRAGTRSVRAADSIATLVADHAPALRLVGLQGYEGILGIARDEPTMTRVDEYLAQWTAAIEAVLDRIEAGAPRIATAGGSMFFDRVLDAFEPLRGDCQIVLRSGGYVTHDSSMFDAASPLGSLAALEPSASRLRAALTVHAVVLSRPEPTMAIVGAGVRDVPVSEGLPVVLQVVDRDGAPKSASGVTVKKANDQHLYLEFAADHDIAVGDVVRLGISHPCAAFERWRVILETDASGLVIGALQTYF